MNDDTNVDYMDDASVFFNLTKPEAPFNAPPLEPCDCCGQPADHYDHDTGRYVCQDYAC